jgi:DNA-binding MarR family transcriptional regulator
VQPHADRAESVDAAEIHRLQSYPCYKKARASQRGSSVVTTLTADVDELVDLRTAADVAGMTVEGVARHVRSRRLPARRIGHKWFVRRDDLHVFIRSRRLGREEGQRLILASLAEQEGATVEQLATLFDCPRRSVLEWLQSLDRQGLIERRRKNRSQAPAHCFLTEDGWQLYREDLAIRSV